LRATQYGDGAWLLPIHRLYNHGLPLAGGSWIFRDALGIIILSRWSAVIILSMKNNFPITSSILGGLSTTDFLRDYWQKKPLLIRQAIPNFKGLLEPQQLLKLACAELVQARLITQRSGQWQLQQGSFTPAQLGRLGKSKWTILVQGVNQHLAAGAALLKQFNFIPHARLDDLMVSYATKGGGVGPHFDSYDVFLLQGQGHRHWQISAQQDRTWVSDAPLKILQNFVAEQEWVLAPGDMLYLPPNYAHNGVAEDECMTYSIGFRAPTQQELAEQFLVYMQDRICLDGLYADPDLKLQKYSSEISADMLHQVEKIIRQVTWGKADIADFLGSYLSEPKSDVFFDPPIKPLSRSRFEAKVQKNGLMLALKSQMLCHGNSVFINGVTHMVKNESYLVLRQLADQRELSAGLQLSEEVTVFLYQSYLDGYVLPS